MPQKDQSVALVPIATARHWRAFSFGRDLQEEKMQAVRSRLSRWTTVGAIAALVAGFACAAEAHDGGRKHGWWKHGRYWAPYAAAPRLYTGYYTPRYYTPRYYAPNYYAPPVVYAPAPQPVYVPPVVSYPETTYVPYTPPGPSLNFTIPLR
jgi:hypothetical protein